jgi:hypothetical protein
VGEVTALLAFFLSNPTIIGIGVAFLGALGFGFHQRLAGAKAERNAQLAKEAAANAKDIDIIQRATGARPVGGVLDDPNNRDNAKG